MPVKREREDVKVEVKPEPGLADAPIVIGEAHNVRGTAPSPQVESHPSHKTEPRASKRQRLTPKRRPKKNLGPPKSQYSHKLRSTKKKASAAKHRHQYDPFFSPAQIPKNASSNNGEDPKPAKPPGPLEDIGMSAKSYRKRLQKIESARALDDVDSLEDAELSLQAFLRETVECVLHRTKVPFDTLIEAPAKQYRVPAGLYDRLENLPSDGRPLCVYGKDNRILAFRIRVPIDLITTLQTTSEALPKVKADRVTEVAVRHYACWVPPFTVDCKPKMSSQYRDQFPFAEEFLEANAPLFKRLSDYLRFLSPSSYRQQTRVFKTLPMHCRPLAGAWLGMTIKEGQDDDMDQGPQRDATYEKEGFNVHVPFGDYDGGGDVILWQLKIKVEMKPGDVLFLMGALMNRNTELAEEGIRKSLELFSQAKVSAWHKKPHFERRAAMQGDL